MYSVDIYLFIAILDLVLTLYAVGNKNADYYKDLFAMGLATFLTVYLSYAAAAGVVLLDGTTRLQDGGLMWIGYLIAFIQGVFLLLEILETIQDYLGQTRQRLIS